MTVHPLASSGAAPASAERGAAGPHLKPGFKHVTRLLFYPFKKIQKPLNKKDVYTYICSMKRRYV